MIILLGAILGFHEWRVENPVSTSRSVFTSLPDCTVYMPEWSQKPERDSPGRGMMALATSDSKDPTQDHFSSTDSYHVSSQGARFFSPAPASWVLPA